MLEFVTHVLGLCPDAHAHLDVLDLVLGGAVAVSATWCWICAATGRLCRVYRQRARWRS